MKKSRFTDSQIMDALKRVEAGLSFPVFAGNCESAPTFYKWRARFGGMDTSMMARMKELEIENAQLKNMYAELALENTAIKDVLSRKL